MKRISTKKWVTWLFFFVAVIFLFSCSPTIKQVKDLKNHWKQQDIQYIAKQEITCTASDEGCNQLHLLKGDACYQLAKKNISPFTNYTLAIKHLETGIEQTQNWQIDDLNLNQKQTYINICESLRNLQDLQSGDEMKITGEKLYHFAEAFYQIDSNHPAAIFYMIKAKYRKIKPELIRKLNKDNNCKELKKMISEVEKAVQMNSEYKQNLEILLRDLKEEKELLECN